MKKLILAAVLAAVMLTGCSNIKNVNDFTAEGSFYDNYGYLIDEHTGVVYIKYNGGNRGGITVALNADGTPVTKEQLEAWRSDE